MKTFCLTVISNVHLSQHDYPYGNTQSILRNFSSNSKGEPYWWVSTEDMFQMKEKTLCLYANGVTQHTFNKPLSVGQREFV